MSDIAQDDLKKLFDAGVEGITLVTLVTGGAARDHHYIDDRCSLQLRQDYSLKLLNLREDYLAKVEDAKEQYHQRIIRLEESEADTGVRND